MGVRPHLSELVNQFEALEIVQLLWKQPNSMNTSGTEWIIQREPGTITTH